MVIRKKKYYLKVYNTVESRKRDRELLLPFGVSTYSYHRQHLQIIAIQFQISRFDVLFRRGNCVTFGEYIFEIVHNIAVHNSSKSCNLDIVFLWKIARIKSVVYQNTKHGFNRCNVIDAVVHFFAYWDWKNASIYSIHTKSMWKIKDGIISGKVCRLLLGREKYIYFLLFTSSEEIVDFWNITSRWRRP